MELKNRSRSCRKLTLLKITPELHGANRGDIAAKKIKELTNGVRTKVGTNLFDAIVAKALKYYANDGNNIRSLRLTSEFVI